VVIVGRNPEKTAQVLAELKQQSGSDQIDMLVADLSIMADIRAPAQAFRAKYARLDVLLNNAGAYFSEHTLTPDGFEMTFALNHLNYFLLTNLLLDVLKASAPARIVNVSSDAHRSIQRIEWDNLQGVARSQAYPLSKLANVLFTRGLARRLEGTGVTANALHPGVVATGFGRNARGVMRVIVTLLAPFFKTPEQGAKTLVYLASSPEVQGINGRYFVDCKVTNPSALAQDDDIARKLWDISAQMVGLTAPV
jgi:NAD(P)-dependent dehydrogenase (short-subunit alcohol dehydrogenase family)